MTTIEHTRNMKLRIHAGSIRLRLKQQEVKALIEGKEVAETCPTAPMALTYSLLPDAALSEMAAESDGARLTVHVPMAWLGGWDVDERVGFESTVGELHLLIEKDFKCASPMSPNENEGCYENPVACP